jgi:site-specific DNA-cytosine methylase
MPDCSKRPDSHKLKHVASWYLKRLPVAERRQFSAAVDSATSEGRPLRVGTMCSGTDSPVVVLDNLAKAVPGLFVKHVFSCEFNERKRSWITANFPNLKLLFGDVNELSARSGKAMNHITGEKVTVPAVDMVIAGFVCKSVSTENNKRSMYANCIREGFGKTGETFDGVMAYVRKFKPAIVICENVKGLTMKTKDEHGSICEPVINHVQQCFKRAAYSFDYHILDSSDFLLPQRRARVWMWAFRGRESQTAAEKTKKSILALRHSAAYRFTVATWQKPVWARAPWMFL